MSGDEQRKRFVVRDSSGRERSLAAVEDLHDEVAAGRVGAADEIFDSSTGAWSPAGKIPVFQFIVEELEAEGRLPERLETALPEPAQTGLPDGGREPGNPTGQGDPLDLSLDLVEPEPLPSPPPQEPEPPLTLQQKLDRVVGADDGGVYDEFEIRPGSALDDDWEALSRVETPTGRSSQSGLGLDTIAPKGPRFRDQVATETRATPPREPPEDAMGGSGEARDDEAIPWQPDDPSGSPMVHSGRKPSAFRPTGGGRGPLVAAAVVVGLLLVGGGWFLFSGGGEEEPGPAVAASPVVMPTLPTTSPPPPPGATDEVEAGLQGVAERFEAAVDSLRGELDLGPAPPREWLAGAYLADARAFPEIRAFWEGYGELLSRLRPMDRSLYLEGVRAGLQEVGRGDDPSLLEYFEDRYDGIHRHREARHESLSAVTRAALDLHEVLVRHRSEISFSPAVGRGVSADPILEAIIPDGPVRHEVEASLDQVFRALDRSRGGGIPSMDGLRSELFQRFGEG